jgi:hypothetical protein
MKIIAITIALILSTSTAQAIQFGNLVSGASYRVWTNDVAGETLVANNGTINFSSIANTKIALEMVETVPTATATPTATETAPTATATPNATLTNPGNELFVASFDNEVSNNRFEILNAEGNSLTGTINILSGITTKATIKNADLNNDDRNEIIASGFNGSSIVTEIWNGQGQMLNSFNTSGSADFQMTIANVDDTNTSEIVIVARTTNNAYTVVASDINGNSISTSEIIAANTGRIESLVAADVDGDGIDEICSLVRNTSNNTINLVINDNGSNRVDVLVFGNGYIGDATAFALDINGDGISEIATVAKNGTNDRFRLLVFSGNGEIMVKENVFSGKFENSASFFAADVDNDGRDEIAGIGRMLGTGTNVLQVLDDNGAKLISRSILDSTYNAVQATSLTDTNNDGQLEFVLGGRNILNGSVAYQVIDLSGSVISTVNSFENGLAGSPSFSTTGNDVLVYGEVADGAFALEVRDGLNGTVLFTSLFSSELTFVATSELI